MYYKILKTEMASLKETTIAPLLTKKINFHQCSCPNYKFFASEQSTPSQILYRTNSYSATTQEKNLKKKKEIIKIIL